MTTKTHPSTRIFQIYIRTTPERIWEAITDPEFTQKYFYGSRVDSTLKPGAPILFHSASGEGQDASGEIVESDPPRRLVHTWRSHWSEEMTAEPASRVTWEIEPQDGGVCQLTVTHDQLEDSPRTAEGIDGWSYILSGLKTLLETGEPMSR